MESRTISYYFIIVNKTIVRFLKMNKITGIYMILNHANDKIYIGQSIDIKARWKQHKSDLNNNRHVNKHLQNSWNKFGQDNFEFIILCECEENQLFKHIYCEYIK